MQRRERQVEQRPGWWQMKQVGKGGGKLGGTLKSPSFLDAVIHVIGTDSHPCVGTVPWLGTER